MDSLSLNKKIAALERELAELKADSTRDAVEEDYPGHALRKSFETITSTLEELSWDWKTKPYIPDSFDQQNHYIGIIVSPDRMSISYLYYTHQPSTEVHLSLGRDKAGYVLWVEQYEENEVPSRYVYQSPNLAKIVETILARSRFGFEKVRVQIKFMGARTTDSEPAPVTKTFPVLEVPLPHYDAIVTDLLTKAYETPTEKDVRQKKEAKQVKDIAEKRRTKTKLISVHL